MNKKEAKLYLKIGNTIFNKKTNKIVVLCSQWNDSFDYSDENKSLYADNNNGFHVFPDSYAVIKVRELEDWEPASIDKLQEHPSAYCNFLYYKNIKLEQRIANSRLEF